MPVLPESPFYTTLPRAAFFGQNHMRAPCFRLVFMYMSKVGTDAHFARKSVLHDVAPRCVFWPKSHVLPESSFYTMLPHAAFFGQNHMRAPCFRPVFMYMSKVGYRCPFCPKVVIELSSLTWAFGTCSLDIIAT